MPMSEEGWRVCLKALRHLPPQCRPNCICLNTVGSDEYPLTKDVIAEVKRILCVLLNPDLYPSITRFVMKPDVHIRTPAWPLPLLRGSHVRTLDLRDSFRGKAALSALEELLSAHDSPVRKLVLNDLPPKEMPSLIGCISTSPCLVELSFFLCIQSQDEINNSVLPLVLDALMDPSALPSLKHIKITIEAFMRNSFGEMRIPRQFSPWRLMLKPSLDSMWVAGECVTWFTPELLDVAEECLDTRAQSGYPPLEHIRLTLTLLRLPNDRYFDHNLRQARPADVPRFKAFMKQRFPKTKVYHE